MRKMEDIYLYTRIYRKTAQCEYNGINNLKSIIEDNFTELNKDLSLQIENFRLCGGLLSSCVARAPL